MATFFMNSKIKKLLILAFVVFTSAMFCFAETNLEKADSYYDKDIYSLASHYYENTIFYDQIYDGKIFYRLAYSYEQLKIQKTIYPKLYSAAAYCFERDNDKENKYYAYSIAKEKDLGLNHNNFSEETLADLTNTLYKINNKENLNKLILSSLLLLFFILMLVAVLDVFIKHFTRKSIKQKNIKYDLSELFVSSNFNNPTMDFNNKLQSIYKSMIECAGLGSYKIRKPENYLLYKFGQVIFTKNGNKVDYNTVSNGLKQIFFSEPNNIEKNNLRINFINKYYEFFQAWNTLQQKLHQNNNLYNIPEIGILLSILSLKMENDDFVRNANCVIELSNNFEKNNVKSYRNDLIVIANKIYHDKTNILGLSAKLENELSSITNKFSNKLKILREKVLMGIERHLSAIIFVYVLLYLFYESSFSILKLFISGISCIVFFMIKANTIDKFLEYDGFNKLMTKAEKEALEREIEEQRERAKTHKHEATNYYEKSDNYKNPVTDNFSQESSKTQRCNYSQTQERPVYNEKPKNQVIKYYCKYCGKDYQNVSALTSNDCPKHPKGTFNGKHSLYHGDTTPPFYCKCCGKQYKYLTDLTSNDCPKHPKGTYNGKHIPYEGFQKEPWICNECGKTYKYLTDLLSNDCPKHKNGPYNGKHTPV